jgi:hypothetical protein
MSLFIALLCTGCAIIFILMVVAGAIEKRNLKHVVIEAAVVNCVAFLVGVPFLIAVYHAPGSLPSGYGFFLSLVPASFFYLLRIFVWKKPGGNDRK